MTAAAADWRRGRIAESAPVAPGIRRLTIERPASRRAEPGAHLDVRVETAAGSDTRSYSVVESNADGSRLTLSVMRHARSRGGSDFMHALRAGDPVWSTGPRQNFPLAVGARRYVLLAGGIGITALIAMAGVLRRLGADYTLVYAGRDREAMAYLPELADRHGERLRTHVSGEGTRLDVGALVAEIAADPRSRGTELYMCGPIRLMEAVRGAWSGNGLPGPNLRYETFGSGGWYEPQAFDVEVPELGVRTTVDAGASLLESLVDAGAGPLYDCRKGECGLCEMAVAELHGRIDHRDVFLSREEQDTGRSLCVCVSRVVAPAGGGRGRLVLRRP